MTRRQRILVFTIAGLMAVAGVATFGYLMYATIRETANPKARPEDRKLVVTASDLAPFGVKEIDSTRESFTAQKLIDGTRMIEYSYFDPAGAPDGSAIHLTSSAQVFLNPLSTIQMYKMQQIGLTTGFAAGKERRIVEAPKLLRTGADQQYAAVMVDKATGKPVGNLFLVRQGRAMFSLSVMGITFDDPATVEKLLGPPLAEARRRFLKGGTG